MRADGGGEVEVVLGARGVVPGGGTPPTPSRARWGLLGLVAGVVVLVVLAFAPGGGPSPEVPPAPGSGLLSWPPRGSLVADEALLDAAVVAWRDAADAGAAAGPGAAVGVVLADEVGREAVLLLQSARPDGSAVLALVAGPLDASDPLEVRRVERLPAASPDVLVLDDVGGVDFGPLLPQAGATLVLPVVAPGLVDEGVRLQARSFGGWEPLGVAEDGRVDAVAYAPGEPWTLLAADRLDPPDGLGAAWQVQAGQLVATPAPTTLADPAWGRAQPATTGEYQDADAVRRILEVSQAEVAVLGAAYLTGPVAADGVVDRAVLAEVRGAAAGRVLAVVEVGPDAGANAGAWWPIPKAPPAPIAAAAVRWRGMVEVVVAAAPGVEQVQVTSGDGRRLLGAGPPPLALALTPAEAGRAVVVVAAGPDGAAVSLRVAVEQAPPAGPG